MKNDPKEIRLPSNPCLKGQAQLLDPIVYSASGQVLRLLKPWQEDARYPLLVFVQGSAWTSPDTGYEIPQLSALARKGYVVASVGHRSSLEGHPFPAFLQDVKTAIRFLRAHAEQYQIDPSRVGIWGTSSGGNAALLVSLTPDAPEYRTEEWPDQSDAVQLVVDCFGPTHMPELMKDILPEILRGGEENEFARIARALAGTSDPASVLEAMSPISYVRPGMALPPYLLLHGDADELVPYAQSQIMFKKLVDCSADARLVRVEGAPHEGGFWSQALLDLIFDFIAEKL